MTIRWTTPAKQDLASIIRYIRRDKPIAAQRAAVTIRTLVTDLASMAYRGRKGEVEGTHELVLNPLPYIAVYRVLADEVQILRIRHAAQDWP